MGYVCCIKRSHILKMGIALEYYNHTVIHNSINLKMKEEIKIRRRLFHWEKENLNVNASL